MPPDIGFTGGEKLLERLRHMSDTLATNPTVRIGFLEGSTYPDGTSVPLVAASQEFGTSRIPPRPFFRNMIKAHLQEWSGQIANLLAANGYDARGTLTTMGQVVKEELQQSIRDTNDPPLAPATVKAKGFSKPLIDTGHMLNSIDYEVEA